MQPQEHRIAVAAQRAGVHPDTMRRWDREGLLVASRNDVGWRYYTEQQIETARRMGRERRRMPGR